MGPNHRPLFSSDRKLGSSKEDVIFHYI